MSNLKKLMGYREYARHRGVSLASVQQAIRTGRIATTIEFGTGKTKIDPVKADQQWELNTDKSKQNHMGPGKPPALHDQPDPIAAATPPPVVEKKNSYNTFRTVRENYEARLSKLQYEKLAGHLLDAKVVEAEIFRLTRQTRDAMLNIPDRIAATFHARLGLDIDLALVHEILDDEIRKALDGLAAKVKDGQ